jgi:hypothetical protein
LQYVYLAQCIRRVREEATDHATETKVWEIRLAPTAEAEHDAASPNGAAVALAAPTSTSTKAYHVGPELLRSVCAKLGLREPRPADLTAVFGAGYHDVIELAGTKMEFFLKN